MVSCVNQCSFQLGLCGQTFLNSIKTRKYPVKNAFRIRLQKRRLFCSGPSLPQIQQAYQFCINMSIFPPSKYGHNRVSLWCASCLQPNSMVWFKATLADESRSSFAIIPWYIIALWGGLIQFRSECLRLQTARGISTHWDLNKWLPFWRQYFQIHLHARNSNSNFTDVFQRVWNQ